MSLNVCSPQKNQAPRAIALLSGGLDSALAAALVKSWGIKVVGLHLNSPFGCAPQAQQVADELKIPLIIKEKGEAFIDLVAEPKYGYGSQMNPCVDCRIYMFQLAEQVLEEQNANFIVTGEVVGQRPLSQNKANMNLIERKSPLEHRILRPLSGGNLPATLPEERGWIERSQLLKLSGRGRSEQLALAKHLGISVYSSPSGGCLLTEAAFSDRLRDFYANPTYANAQEKLAQAQMLRLGRHFKISPTLKVIVSRNKDENEEIIQRWEQSGATLYEPVNYKGPVAVSLGTSTNENTYQIAELLAKYGRKDHGAPFLTRSRRKQMDLSKEVECILTTEQMISDATLEKLRIGIT